MNKNSLVFCGLVVALSLMASKGTAAAPVIDGLHALEVRVYSYRVDAAEHPDFKLPHYDRIHRDTRPGGLDFFKGPLPGSFSGKLNRVMTKNEGGGYEPWHNPESLMEDLASIWKNQVTL